MRLLLFLFLSTASLLRLFAQNSTLDPSFEKVPFDRWLSEGNPAHFHWTAAVPRAQLSFHQRLISEVEIKLDGRDLLTRRGKGKLVFLVQITDKDGARFQQHGSVDLSKLDENVKSIDLGYSQRQFILPGDYELAIVIFDTATGEHSANQSQFHIAPPRKLFNGGLAQSAVCGIYRQRRIA